MNKNLHAYRNLGVSCLKAHCSHCACETTHSAYFEIDAQREKVFSLGCCNCGRGASVSESVYDDLYELSFDFDRFASGELGREAFDTLIPRSCRGFVEGKDFNQTVANSEKSPANRNLMAEAADAVIPVSQRTDLPLIELRNRPSALLGTGLTMAILLGVAVLAVGLFIDLRELLTGAGLIGLYFGVMLAGLAAGILMSSKRFPKRVVISPEYIEIFARGSQGALRYTNDSVSRVNYGEGAKYLTLWFSDGKTFVVEAGGGVVEELDRYYGQVK